MRGIYGEKEIWREGCSSRGVVASAPDFERADEGSILTAGLCFKSGKSECNNSGYKLTGLTWWP